LGDGELSGGEGRFSGFFKNSVLLKQPYCVSLEGFSSTTRLLILIKIITFLPLQKRDHAWFLIVSRLKHPSENKRRRKQYTQLLSYAFAFKILQGFYILTSKYYKAHTAVSNILVTFYFKAFFKVTKIFTILCYAFLNSFCHPKKAQQQE